MIPLKKKLILNKRNKDLVRIAFSRAKFFIKKIPHDAHWEPEHYKSFHLSLFLLRQAILRIVLSHEKSGLTTEGLRFIQFMKNFHHSLSEAPFYFSDPNGPGFTEILSAFQKGNLIHQIELALNLCVFENEKMANINAVLNTLRLKNNLLDRFYANRINLKMADETRDSIMQEYLSRLKLLAVFPPTFVLGTKKWFNLGLLSAKRDCLATLLELLAITLESSPKDSQWKVIKHEQQKVINNRLQPIVPKKTIVKIREDFKSLDNFSVYKDEDIYKIANIINKRNCIRPPKNLSKTVCTLDAEKVLLADLKIAWNIYAHKGTQFQLKNVVIKMRIHSLTHFVSLEFREQLANAEIKLQIPIGSRSLHWGLLNSNQIWV